MGLEEEASLKNAMFWLPAAAVATLCAVAAVLSANVFSAARLLKGRMEPVREFNPEPCPREDGRR